ncbi:MAG: glycoside hydrolase family 28 protein, partial [Clostridia bacterium]|nr:glycoside hydrolase family 28 protein [Clostridia bacterium]
MFKKLFVSSVSACFELKNKNPYYSPESYEVMLNGKLYGRFDTNVFSLFNLTPDTQYTVSAGGTELNFKTFAETEVVNVKALGSKADGKSDDTYFVQMAID